MSGRSLLPQLCRLMSSLASPGLRSPWSTSSYAFPHVISRKQSQAQPQPQDGDAKVVVAEKVGAASSASPRPRESTLADPSPPGAEKDYAPKVRKIVDDIAALTLMEVADLNELLKKTLKIPDQTFMSTGNFAPAQAAAVSEDDGAAKKKEKSAFTIKLLKFDDTRKVQLIKEIKNLVEGMNLVQAKKYVESLPQTVRQDIGKDEAEKLKAALEAVGGTVEMA